jgi:Fe-S-cluster containining protein
MLTTEEQAAFALSKKNVEQTVARHLRTLKGRPSVVAFIANLQHGVSQILDGAIEQGVGVACKAACKHCCHARVEALAPEVFLIARELKGWPSEELAGLMQKLRAHVAAKSSASAWSQRSECPFLTSDLCAIYDVRPSVCRRAHSLDVRKCEANSPEIPQDLGVVVNIEALTKGTADAYRQLGFDPLALELAPAVLLALVDPSAESRWLNGEPVF